MLFTCSGKFGESRKGTGSTCRAFSVKFGDQDFRSDPPQRALSVAILPETVAESRLVEYELVEHKWCLKDIAL